MNTEILLGKIEEADKLSFEKITSESGTLFSKVWGQAFLSSLLIVLFSALAGIIFFIPYLVSLIFFGLASDSMDFHVSNDERVRIVSYIFGGMFSVAVGAIFIGVSAAFCRICKMKDHNRDGFHDYYYFLKKKYFSKLLVLALLSMAIIVPSVVYFSYIPLVYLAVPIGFITVIFAFNPEMSAKDIITVGFKLGTEKWGISIGFILFFGFISMVTGFILCGLGFILTMTFVNIPLYFIYKHIFDFDDEKPVDAYQEKTDLIIQKINELNVTDKKR